MMDGTEDKDPHEGGKSEGGDAQAGSEQSAEKSRVAEPSENQTQKSVDEPKPDAPEAAATSEVSQEPKVSQATIRPAQDGQVKAPKSARQAIEPDTPPPPPSRSKAVRHPVVVFMNFMLSVVLLAVIGVAGLLYFGKQTFSDKGPLTQEKTILVSRGTGLGTIASILERQNVISNKLVFEYGVQLYKKDSQLKAGEYLFSPGLSMHQVMNILTSGKSILHSVTIPEGYTSYQAFQVIKSHKVLVGDLADVPVEGSILPETYKFSRGTTRAEILKRMTEARNRALDEIWSRRVADLPLANKEELVTLASIVEKETGQAGERTRVAGVFVNRLRQGIKLQSDPTVIYGIFGGKGKPKGRPIFRSDLNKKTDFNTYQIPALTPGPIANPGRAAMEAVANPSRTKDLFFVADGTGGHAFAETLAQHNANVKRWREIEKERIKAQKKKQAEQEGAAVKDKVEKPVE